MSRPACPASSRSTLCCGVMLSAAGVMATAAVVLGLARAPDVAAPPAEPPAWLASLAGVTAAAGGVASPSGVYRIHSDLDAATTAVMVEELELAHAEYVRRLDAFLPTPEGPARPVRASYDVYLFAGRDDYDAFTGGQFPHSGGIFVAHKRALAAVLEGQGRDQMRKTLRHEAFHQYAHARFGHRLPTWLNEGLAQVFEEAVRVDVPGGEPELRVGQVTPDRVRRLRADLAAGRLLDFASLLDMSDAVWTRALVDSGHASTQYTQAWAMVHFLVWAAGPDGQPLYRDRFNAMLRDIAAGARGTSAFRRHFGENLPGFRERFDGWVREVTATGPASVLEQQHVLAELQILLAGRGQRFEAIDDFRRYVVSRGYRLQCRRDDLAWMTDPDPGVYFRDARARPLDARRLRLVPDPAGDLPQIVRRPGDGLVYRTRFYTLGGQILHETGVERE